MVPEEVEEGAGAEAQPSANAGADDAAAAAEVGKETPAEPKSVRGAVAEARARVEKGESIVPPEDDEEDEGAEAKPSKDEEAAGEEGASAEEGDEGEEKGDEGAGKGEAEAEGEEDADDDAEGDDDGEGDEDDAGDVAVARLPGRGKDDPDIEIEIPKELEEDFNRLKNGYMRGEEARRQAEALEEQTEKLRVDQEELRFIDQQLEVDPVGFVIGHVKDQKLKVDLLRNLIADDATWNDESLQEDLRTWENEPEKRELFQERTARKRLENERDLSDRRRIREESRQGARETMQHVKALVPEEWGEDRRGKFWTITMNLLGELAGKKGSSRFSREQVIDELEKQGVLEGYGIDAAAARASVPDEGTDRFGRGGKGSERGADGRKERPSVRRKTPPTEEEARETGKRLKEESGKRRAAAAIAPAGAGAPAAATELPKGQNVRDRIATVRKLGGIRRILGGGKK